MLCALPGAVTTRLFELLMTSLDYTDAAALGRTCHALRARWMRAMLNYLPRVLAMVHRGIALRRLATMARITDAALCWSRLVGAAPLPPRVHGMSGFLVTDAQCVRASVRYGVAMDEDETNDLRALALADMTAPFTWATERQRASSLIEERIGTMPHFNATMRVAMQTPGATLAHSFARDAHAAILAGTAMVPDYAQLLSYGLPQASGQLQRLAQCVMAPLNDELSVSHSSHMAAAVAAFVRHASDATLTLCVLPPFALSSRAPTVHATIVAMLDDVGNDAARAAFQLMYALAAPFFAYQRTKHRVPPRASTMGARRWMSEYGAYVGQEPQSFVSALASGEREHWTSAPARDLLTHYLNVQRFVRGAETCRLVGASDAGPEHSPLESTLVTVDSALGALLTRLVKWCTHHQSARALIATDSAVFGRAFEPLSAAAGLCCVTLSVDRSTARKRKMRDEEMHDGVRTSSPSRRIAVATLRYDTTQRYLCIDWSGEALEVRGIGTCGGDRVVLGSLRARILATMAQHAATPTERWLIKAPACQRCDLSESSGHDGACDKLCIV